MKRVLVVALVIAMVLSMFLVGCTSNNGKHETTPVTTNEGNGPDGDSSSTDKTVLNVMHRWPPESGNNYVYADIFKAFDDKHDNIDVVIESVPPAMYEAQLTVRLASDAAPDVYCLWPGGRVESQVRNGTILDIRDLWEENGWFDEFTQNVIGGCTHTDGNIYSLPMNNLTNVFWYNVKIFDEVGVEIPTTWDELMVAAQKIKQAGYTPFALGGNPTRWMPALWFDYLLLNSAGGEFRENLMWGKESWESDEVHHVFELWKDAIDKGYFNEDYASIDDNQATALLVSQKCAMMLCGPWTINTLMSDEMGMVPEKDFNMFAFPVVDENVAPAFEGCIECWCINAKSQKVDAAEELLTYWGEADTVEYFCKGLNFLGSRKDTTFDIFSDETRNIMKILSDSTSQNPLHQNFELATLPAMQDAGMDAIIEFMTFPDAYKDICKRVEAVSRETFD